MKEGTVDVFDGWLANRLEGVHTLIPGTIISYEGHNERKAEVQPAIKLHTKKGVLLEIPPIKNVPVVFPSSGTANILFELKKGDGVLLLFSEGSIGTFLNSAGTNQVNPEDATRFSLTDCIAVPGLWSFPRAPQTEASEDSLHLEKEGSFVEIKSDSIAMTDTNGNTVTCDNNGTLIEDANGNTIEMTAGEINIDGSAININGNSKQFVTHAELTTAISTFISTLNTHTHICAAPEALPLRRYLFCR